MHGNAVLGCNRLHQRVNVRTFTLLAIEWHDDAAARKAARAFRRHRVERLACDAHEQVGIENALQRARCVVGTPLKDIGV